VAGNDSVAGSDSTGSDSAAGNGDVTVPLLQCPELIALPSQQGSVFAALKAQLRIGTWVAQQHQTMSPLVQPGLHTPEKSRGRPEESCPQQIPQPDGEGPAWVTKLTCRNKIHNSRRVIKQLCLLRRWAPGGSLLLTCTPSHKACTYLLQSLSK